VQRKRFRPNVIVGKALKFQRRASGRHLNVKILSIISMWERESDGLYLAYTEHAGRRFHKGRVKHTKQTVSPELDQPNSSGGSEQGARRQRARLKIIHMYRAIGADHPIPWASVTAALGRSLLETEYGRECGRIIVTIDPRNSSR
jgi:hypothetical protein